MVREKRWRDIGHWYGTMMIVSAVDLGSALSEKLDACAKHDDSLRNKYRWRDVITAALAKPAGKTKMVRDTLTGEFGPMLSIVGMFGGLSAGFYTAVGAWGLLGTGTAALSVGGVAGAFLGLAAGIAAVPLAATAIGVGISIVLPMAAATACFWPTMLHRGLREAGLCRQYRKNPPKIKPPQAPKKPPVTDDLESHLRIIGMEKGPDRESFLRSLRKRFPEEFNEAANLDALDPVLRGPVTVKAPLKFRAPAKMPDQQKGGAP